MDSLEKIKINKMKYCFGDIVIVEGNLIGVVVKSWCRSSQGKNPYHEVYVRSLNTIKDYFEYDMERYMVRHKEITEEELEWNNNVLLGK